MSFEDRLQNHLHEQANQIDITVPDVSTITDDRRSSGRGATLAIAAAVLLVAATGYAFLATGFGSSDGNEIAAGGEADGDGDADQPSDGTEINTVAYTELEFTDVSGDLTPTAWNQYTVEDGVYYILSTAPGRMDPNINYEENFELFTPRTFYTFDGEWQAGTVEDRLVSGFDVEDGVIYVVSTGTLAGESTFALGTSSDRGATWSWQNQPNLDDALMASVSATEDALLIAGARGSSVTFDEGLELANEAGLGLTSYTYNYANNQDVEYLATHEDLSATCATALINRDLLWSLSYGSQEITDELDRAEAAFLESEATTTTAPEEATTATTQVPSTATTEAAPTDATVADSEDFYKPAFEGQVEELLADGCNPEDVELMRSGDAVSLENRKWSDLGVSVPEAWKSWLAVYRIEEGSAIDITPTDIGDEAVLYGRGYAGAPSLGNEEGIALVSLPSSESTEEIHYRTIDGFSWEQDSIDYENCFEDCYAFGGVRTASALALQMRWPDEPSQEEYDALEAAGEYWNPIPTLQGKNADGEWVDIETADLVSGADLASLEGLQFSEIFNHPFGAFLVYREPYDPNNESFEPLRARMLYSADGASWTLFEQEIDSIGYYQGTGDLLVVLSDWDMVDGWQRISTETFLVTPIP